VALRSETPPPPANLSVDAPPASDKPTSAMLKADIDSGATGDKIEHYDVGMAQLGTCDEVAGTPPTPERVALARKTEAATRSARQSADPHGRRGWVMPAFAGFIVATAVVIGGAFWIGS
jgi:hypothetical protein